MSNLFPDPDDVQLPAAYEALEQGVRRDPSSLFRAGIGATLVLGGLSRRSLTGLMVALGGGALVYSTRRRRHVRQLGSLPVHAVATMTVDASADSLYTRWRDLARLPELLAHVRSVEALEGGRSRWTVDGPVGPLSWESEITVDEPGRRICWRSLPEGAVDQEGEVSFRPAPGDRGTVITIRLRYAPPGGRFGAAVAGLLGLEPGQALREDLRRLKQQIEAGEIATAAIQPAARADPAGKAGRLAQRGAEAVQAFSAPHHMQEIR